MLQSSRCHGVKKTAVSLCAQTLETGFKFLSDRWKPNTWNVDGSATCTSLFFLSSIDHLQQDDSKVNEELQLAVRNNDVDGVKAAIEEGADVPLGAIWVTIWGSLEMVGGSNTLILRHDILKTTVQR